MKSVDPLTGVVTFLLVAQAKSFSSAAEGLGVSRATVSAQITDLEQRLGVLLLRRNTRRISLTEAGRKYFEALRGIDTALDAAARAAADVQTRTAGRLRVTTQAELGHHLVIPVLADFIRAYPDIDLELHLSPVAAPLVGSRFDLAINSAVEPAETQIVRKLGLSPMRLVASPAYIREHGEPRHPDDLRDHQGIALAGGLWDRFWMLDQAGDEVRVVPQARLDVASGDALRQAVLCGIGIALLPDFALGDDFRAGRIVPLLPDWSAPDIEVNIVYPANRHIPVKVRTFVNFLTAEFERRSRQGLA